MRSGDHSPLSLQKGFKEIWFPFLLSLGVEYYVYIIYSSLRDKYYVGYTSDPESRIAEHNSGATVSTRNGKPWSLLYKEKFPDKSSAIKRENQIKKMKSRKYIENLIRTLPVG